MNIWKKIVASGLALFASLFAVAAQAVAPAWVETSVTAFSTSIGDVLTVLVPLFLGVVATMIVPGLVSKFMRRAAK